MSWKIPERCYLCGQPFKPGERFLGHARLGVTWHAEHDSTDVSGEDVTTHTLFHGEVPAIDRIKIDPLDVAEKALVMDNRIGTLNIVYPASSEARHDLAQTAALVSIARDIRAIREAVEAR